MVIDFCFFKNFTSIKDNKNKIQSNDEFIKIYIKNNIK